MKRFLVAVILFILVAFSHAAEDFINWESAHTHSLDLAPNGRTLLAVNTAGARLEVFDVVGRRPVHRQSIPVGLEPVAARMQSNSIAWVVNHVSDSISVVDLISGQTIASIPTLDEPSDVVFAGAPLRAFVSCSQANVVQVFETDGEFIEIDRVLIEGEDPRALAVSKNREQVYVAIFESGNRTTLLGGGAAINGSFPPKVVNDPLGPYGGLNPPPNDGVAFDPPVNPQNPPAPQVGHIVRENDLGMWFDDNDADWTELVSGSFAERSGRVEGWTLADHDLAIIHANTRSISYVRRLMNLAMGIATHPITGQVTMVGTEALNEIRFEPNLNGVFLRVQLAMIDAVAGVGTNTSDLNPHLDYSVPNSTPALRQQSIGDPRGVVWEEDGSSGYVSGMGSNNVIVLGGDGQRAASHSPIEVGQGPTGLVVHGEHQLLYVLNRFEGTVSVVDLETLAEVDRIAFFDPTPETIRAGRTFLYGTHETSGHGHVSCASCHVDARTDRLAWDLGNPSGSMQAMDQNCNFGSEDLSGFGPCEDWHPMKGPMVTTTLQDIIGKEPLHWRGDRTGLSDFNQAYMSLLGDDEVLDASELELLRQYLASLYFPPNPFRDNDNSLADLVELSRISVNDANDGALRSLPPGRPELGLQRFTVGGGDLSCSFCHTLPTGLGTSMLLSSDPPAPFPLGPDGEQRHAVIDAPVAPGVTIKIPQLRNLHEKIGFELGRSPSLSGFGYLHDGTVDSLSRFMGLAGSSDQEIADVVSFVISLSGSDLPSGVGIPVGPPGPPSRDTHAGVGEQLTVCALTRDESTVQDWLALFLLLTDSTLEPESRIGLIAKTNSGGASRGYVHVGQSILQSDRALEVLSVADLLAGLEAEDRITFTVVPRSLALRIGVDQDGDGFFDADEMAACSAPDHPHITPGHLTISGDADFDNDIDQRDYRFFRAMLDQLSQRPGAMTCTIDGDGDFDVDLRDVQAFQIAFGNGP